MKCPTFVLWVNSKKAQLYFVLAVSFIVILCILQSKVKMTQINLFFYPASTFTPVFSVADDNVSCFTEKLSVWFI
jgi:hypothetical protein